MSDQLVHVAYHEAAHAVIAASLHYDMVLISIEPETGSRGRLRHRWDAAFRSALRTEEMSIQQAVEYAAVARAGRAAEARLTGEGRNVRWGVDGSEQDDADALEMAGRAVGPDDAHALVAFAGELAKTWVAFHWTAISAVAARLLEQRTLSADEIAMLLDESNRTLDHPIDP